MRVCANFDNDLYTVQVVEENGKYIVRYESSLTTPAWDKAGISGPYWVKKGEFDTYQDALNYVKERYPSVF
jgi:hypothetical protein